MAIDRVAYAGLARNAHEVTLALKLAALVFRGDNNTQQNDALKTTLMSPFEPINQDNILIVTLYSGDICGTVFLINRNFFTDDEDLQGTFISLICIAPSERGNGFSKILMEEAIAQFRKRKSVFAILIARRAVDFFYNKFGFWGVS